MDETLSSTSMRYDVATSFVYEPEKIITGVATGSVTRPIAVHALISDDVEPVVHTPKAVVATTYPLQDCSLLVVNVHGRNRGGLEPLITQLEKLSGYLNEHQGPVILAGDFNTNSAAKTEWLMAFVSRLGLKVVGFDPDQRKYSKLSRQPLDWVFVRGLEIVESAVPVAQGSDHRPLTSTLSLERATTS